MGPTDRIPPLARVLPRIAASELSPPPGVRIRSCRYGPHSHQHALAFTPRTTAGTAGRPATGRASEPARGSLPWVYFIHGGGWSSGSPRQYAFVARFLAARGFPTVLAGYRLAPRHRWPAQLEDVAVGLVAVTECLPELAPKPAVLAGFSAGGQLAAMLAEGAAGELPVGAAGLMLVSAPVDFSEFATSPYIEGLTGHSAPWPEADPMTYLDGALPPVLVVQGLQDPTVPPSGPRRFADAAEALSPGSVEYLEVPWAHHADSLDLFLRSTPEGDRILGWLEARGDDEDR